mmetsp:Transcript_53480/g.134624  ORF Transcript_53480/g.134624 Transcript_53480/m.134624 type:complete len:153 (-) Transcript_53480:332-790(-)
MSLLSVCLSLCLCQPRRAAFLPVREKMGRLPFLRAGEGGMCCGVAQYSFPFAMRLSVCLQCVWVCRGLRTRDEHRQWLVGLACVVLRSLTHSGRDESTPLQCIDRQCCSLIWRCGDPTPFMCCVLLIVVVVVGSVPPQVPETLTTFGGVWLR